MIRVKVIQVNTCIKFPIHVNLKHHSKGINFLLQVTIQHVMSCIIFLHPHIRIYQMRGYHLPEPIIKWNPLVMIKPVAWTWYLHVIMQHVSFTIKYHQLDTYRYRHYMSYSFIRYQLYDTTCNDITCICSIPIYSLVSPYCYHTFPITF